MTINKTLLVRTLNELADSPTGKLLYQLSSSSEIDQSKRHHLDILSDLGLVQWIPREDRGVPRWARITAKGYSFLGVLADDSDNAGKDAFDLAESAVGIVAASAKIITTLFG